MLLLQHLLVYFFLVREFTNHRIATLLEQCILVGVPTKLSLVSISSLLCEATLTIKDIIKIFNSLCIKGLHSSKELLLDREIQLLICKQQSQECIHLGLTLALIINQLIACLTTNIISINDQPRCSDLSTELLDQGSFTDLGFILNGEFHPGDDLK